MSGPAQSTVVQVRRLDTAEARARLSELAAVLVDCVEGGASVSFMPPFTQSDAEAFFSKVISGVEAGERILLAGFIDKELSGTVQLITATPPNQPHRADVAKLLVLRSARRSGLGAMLMCEVERQAIEAGRTLLTLDTVRDAAGDRLYRRLGWTAAGVIPQYALNPDGSWCDTVIFWKNLDTTD